MGFICPRTSKTLPYVSKCGCRTLYPFPYFIFFSLILSLSISWIISIHATLMDCCHHQNEHGPTDHPRFFACEPISRTMCSTTAEHLQTSLFYSVFPRVTASNHISCKPRPPAAPRAPLLYARATRSKSTHVHTYARAHVHTGRSEEKDPRSGGDTHTREGFGVPRWPYHHFLHCALRSLQPANLTPRDTKRIKEGDVRVTCLCAFVCVCV